MAQKLVLRGLQVLVTAVPSTECSRMKLALLTHRPKSFALSFFSDSGDGPHWVIHTLPQAPKNPGDCLFDKWPGLVMQGMWLWGRGDRQAVGPRALLGWGGWKERLSLRLVSCSLMRSTYPTEPRNGVRVTSMGSVLPLPTSCFCPSRWSVSWHGGARRVPALRPPVFWSFWIKPGKLPPFHHILTSRQPHV